MYATTPGGAVVRKAAATKPSSKVLSIPFVLLYLVTLSCGDSSSTILAPDEPSVDLSVAQIVMVAGDLQEAQVGEPLSQSLRIRVVDPAGQPMAGVPIDWNFTDGQGRPPTGPNAVDSFMSPTDAEGYSTVVWILGTRAGDQLASATIQTAPATQPSGVNGADADAAPPSGKGPKKVNFRARGSAGSVATLELSPNSLQIHPAEIVRLSASATDRYGNVISDATFTWTSRDPGVVAVDSSGAVTGMVAGSTEVLATSESVSAGAAVEVTTDPQIVTTSLPAGVVGSPYAHSLSATGGDGSYVWAIASGALPSGLSLVSTGTISGTPSAAGTASFDVSVTSAGQSATASLSITTSTSLPAPAVTTTSLAGGVVGTAYSQTLSATGGDGSYAWAIASGALPSGLSLAASTGVISGTPTAAGTASFTVRVTSAGQVATKSLSMTTTAATPAPSITTTSLPGSTVGTAYSQTLSATGGDGSYAWAIASGALPSGLSLGSSTGTISGTPSAAGTASFTVRVTSAGQVATKSLSITTAPAVTAPSVTTSSLPGGTVGTSYSRTLSATGGDGTYTWSMASGSLPSGLSLSTGGTISGTPTTAGTSSFTVRVQSAGLSGTRGLSITVSSPPPPPGGYRRNMPAGLTVIDDYGFDDDLAPHSGFYEGPLGNSGWTGIDWACTGCAIRRMADASSPDGSGYVLEEVYPPHLSGGGPSSFYRSVPATGTFYMSWIVKWEAGFDHNSNSEKMVYFNPNASDYFLFQFHWGSEAMYHVTQADGDGSLRANQMPTDGTGWHEAPPVDGRWVEYEFLFEQSTGRIRWWRDGVLHADHTGRSFPRVDRVKVSTTWGGNGDKQGTHSRYTDHIFIAGK